MSTIRTPPIKLRQTRTRAALQAGGMQIAPVLPHADLIAMEKVLVYFRVMRRVMIMIFLSEKVGWHGRKSESSPTRFRPGQLPSLLDVLLTNEEGMI